MAEELSGFILPSNGIEEDGLILTNGRESRLRNHLPGGCLEKGGWQQVSI